MATNRLFQLAPNVQSSETLLSAMDLAEEIFFTSRSKKIILRYNTRDCTIDKIETEFNQSSIDTDAISRIGITQKEEDKFYEEFAFSRPLEITLNAKLISLCIRIRKQDEGYSRVVLFVAIVIFLLKNYFEP